MVPGEAVERLGTINQVASRIALWIRDFMVSFLQTSHLCDQYLNPISFLLGKFCDDRQFDVLVWK